MKKRRAICWWMCVAMSCLAPRIICADEPLVAGTQPEGTDEEDSAPGPSYEPAFDIHFSGASPSVNRRGLPQHWQTAPDSELPADFAPGDELVEIWSAQPRTLTPMIARDVYAEAVHAEVLEKLVWQNLGPPYQYVPGLAKRWRVSDDGLTIDFELFAEAKWSDGQPVTARDVAFSFDTLMDERIDAGPLRDSLRGAIESYAITGERSIRFKMKERLFDNIGLCGNVVWIIPQHVYAKYSPAQYNHEIRDVCVGSGMWKLDHWTDNHEIVFVRNENYWGPKAALERVVVKFVPNELAELQDFMSGQVDMIGPTQEQWVANINSERLKSRNGRGLMYWSPERGFGAIGYNLRLKKLGDKRTREALTMLIDREGIVTNLMGGLGIVPTGPFFIHGKQYDSSIQPWPYDVERAKQLLRDAGWRDDDHNGVLEMDVDGDGKPDELTLRFLAPTSAMYRAVQTQVQRSFAQAGIKVELETAEWGVFQERVMKRDFEMIMQAFASKAEVDAFAMWHSSNAEPGGGNVVGFSNAKADALIDEARKTLDEQKRIEMWHDLHRIIHDEQPMTFLWTGPRLAFIDDRFRHVEDRNIRLHVSEWYVPADLQKRGSAVKSATP
ncbi:MAG TPA: ABC transporter substrate-binding protein [Phycisphaerales bacterium]|nr:ABC transporter substrate-binding protein [Phycisphaerales bacterium]